MAEPWFEVAFGAHYPALYAHRDRDEAALCFELLPRLAPFSPHQKPVLDLGCGDGRHLEFLREGSWLSLGVDLSAPLLQLAAKRPHQVPLIRGDMRFLSFQDHSLDTVLSLFTAFGYFGPLQENRNVVAEIARVLAPGGHWFLDYFNCDRVVAELGSEKPFVRVRQERGMSIRETRRYSTAEGVVSKDVELLPSAGSTGDPDTGNIPPGGLRYTEKVAVFSLQEMDGLALACGLQRVAGAGGYDGGDLDGGSRWILVYRKQEPR